MFKAIYSDGNPHKITTVTQLVTVFAVRQNKVGYPLFLIYLNGEWIWRSAKHFVPCDD